MLLNDVKKQVATLPRSRVVLAMYKGPPETWPHKLSHWGIRVWLLSQYSHSELVIDGLAYSSSMRDGGVRAKQIDFDTDRWDFFALPGADEHYALRYFKERKGLGYDYKGVAAYPFPFIKHSDQRFFCFELTAGMLKLPKPEKATPRQLTDHAHLLAERAYQGRPY